MSFLADKMIQLGLGIGTPEGIEIQSIAIAQVFKTGHVANGGVEPDVEIFSRLVWNFETKVGGVSRDVPIHEARVKPFLQLVGDLRLQSTGACPLEQQGLEVAEFDEEVHRLAGFGRRAGQRRDRIDQVGGLISGAATFAIVSVLIERLAAGTGTANEAVGQKQTFDRIPRLRDRASIDMATRLE